MGTELIKKKRNKRRTRSQNDFLIMEICDELSKGGHLKQIASDFQIPLHTITNLISRYRKRYGIKSIYQLIAIHITLKERKKKPS